MCIRCRATPWRGHKRWRAIPAIGSLLITKPTGMAAPLHSTRHGVPLRTARSFLRPTIFFRILVLIYQTGSVLQASVTLGDAFLRRHAGRQYAFYIRFVIFYNDCKNFINRPLSVLLNCINCCLAFLASPSCHSMASSMVLARPSCR
jgi:hypothetical protein